MRKAIISLTDAVDALIPFVITDAEVIERARRANEEARASILEE